jgi:hypothetical protein
LLELHSKQAEAIQAQARPSLKIKVSTKQTKSSSRASTPTQTSTGTPPVGRLTIKTATVSTTLRASAGSRRGRPPKGSAPSDRYDSVQWKRLKRQLLDAMCVGGMVLSLIPSHCAMWL